ncbi:nitrate reductase cytochrome c-type subunit [Helicobacter turcicus]|uniref:Periplasmic nitrate reductase, electron transfer subunit n=1 Tax=Helicobacter turcicus TaxID=2867412 RepID=A0ABS7JNG6_9HELI|nr:nitrate reductase cytochrome c-type subunit [Helicobacter turcicus]MBX7490945.1 nitrate reductase cytochrome c-type subunit [Helicobacter turcicus]MBX7545799.1 nitrate reductase cytochrome c-type subunit [Helicobacter turcicus]
MNIKKFALASLAVAGLIFLGCKAGQSYGENEIGLRKSTLFNEDAKIERIDYSGKAAGESELIERAFENAPPMISHNVEDMLPITKENNSCTSCHLPGVAEAVAATPMPKSHFYNFRDNVDMKENMDETRFNCVICHATQVSATPLVENKFTPDFRKENGNIKSNLLDVINEGVN